MTVNVANYVQVLYDLKDEIPNDLIQEIESFNNQFSWKLHKKTLECITNEDDIKNALDEIMIAILEKVMNDKLPFDKAFIQIIHFTDYSTYSTESCIHQMIKKNKVFYFDLSQRIILFPLFAYLHSQCKTIWN